MKKNYPLKEFLSLCVVMILLPFALYYFIKLPWEFDAIGGEDASKVWLGFWGGYLGAIISASVAFFILDKQLKNNYEQNNENRKLQIKVIEHQQKQQRLNDFKKVAVDYISAFNTNNLVAAVNSLEYYPKTSYDETKNMFVYLGISKAKIGLYKSDDAHINVLFESLNTLYNEFGSATNDIHCLSVLLLEKKKNTSINIREYINDDKNNFSEGIKSIINSDTKESDVDKLISFAKEKCSSTNDIFKKVSELIQAYTIEEQKRINNILL